MEREGFDDGVKVVDWDATRLGDDVAVVMVE